MGCKYASGEAVKYLWKSSILDVRRGCKYASNVPLILLLSDILQQLLAEAYSELSQIAKMRIFAKIVNGL